MHVASISCSLAALCIVAVAVSDSRATRSLTRSLARSPTRRSSSIHPSSQPSIPAWPSQPQSHPIVKPFFSSLLFPPPLSGRASTSSSALLFLFFHHIHLTSPHLNLLPPSLSPSRPSSPPGSLFARLSASFLEFVAVLNFPSLLASSRRHSRLSPHPHHLTSVIESSSRTTTKPFGKFLQKFKNEEEEDNLADWERKSQKFGFCLGAHIGYSFGSQHHQQHHTRTASASATHTYVHVFPP